MEVRLWHELGRYVSLIAAKTTEGRSLFAPAFLCEHSRNEENRGQARVLRFAVFCPGPDKTALHPQNPAIRYCREALPIRNRESLLGWHS